MYAKTVTPILNVSDLSQSFDWFECFGWQKRWEYGESPDFGAVGSGAVEIFLCVDGQGGRGEDGVWVSIWVDDVDAVHAHCQERGLDVMRPPTDEEWNVREMLIQHPDGHVFRVSQAQFGDETELETALRESGPPLPIDRAEVPVRIEQRLAALLHDLAAHKHMSLSSCLEETLLHISNRWAVGWPAPTRIGPWSSSRP